MGRETVARDGGRKLPGKSVAVVGCGHWGPNHIRVLLSLPACSSVTAVDSDPDRLAAMAEMFPAVGTSRDFVSVLEDERIDAVVIATPVTEHYWMTRDALLAGRHVLCEKPLCRTSQEAEELAVLARQQQLQLMVGHIFLFNPAGTKVKELVDEGELGDVRYLFALRTNLGPGAEDVDVIYDLASHDIAAFNWLLSSAPQAVSATAQSFLRPGVNDVAFISLRYGGGVVANLHVSWLEPRKVRQVTVVGSKKAVTWDDLQPSTPVAIFEKGEEDPKYANYGEFMRVAMWDGDVRLPRISVEEPLKAQDRAFLEAVEQGGVTRSDGSFGAEIVRVLEAVNCSIAQDGRMVAVAGAPSERC